jgi:serine protease SohB
LSEFLAEYGIFVAKLVTVLVLLICVVGALFFMIMRTRSVTEGHLAVRHLNQKYGQMQLMLNSAVQPKKQFRKTLKEFKVRMKKEASEGQADRPRMFVLDFAGDLRASEVTSLREEITALLTITRENDEVLVRLESGGGTVHGYGLAASQLKRIRDRKIRLTVSVDKVAASGGYMMACVADRIIAAPFAVIGSIGVLAQIPNFHRLLKKHDIDFEQISAGRYKRTMTVFGENTEADRSKLKEEIENTHDLFKQFVRENRPVVDVDSIATGETWYGRQAIENKLVDDLRTSDDFLSAAVSGYELYEIEYARKKPLLEKMFRSTMELFSPESY